MNDYNERITSNLISALSAMTAAFIGAAIGLFFFGGLAYDALDIAHESADRVQQAEQRAEEAEYELKRFQAQYESDLDEMYDDLWTCRHRNLDLKAHCPLYAAP